MLVILADSRAQVNNHQENESTFPTPGRQDLDSGDKSPCPRAGLSLWNPEMKSETRGKEDQSNSTSICLFQSDSLTKFLKGLFGLNFYVVGWGRRLSHLHPTTGVIIQMAHHSA